MAKMLFAFTGWLIGYDGHFLFDNIGDSYIDNNVPYVGLRSLPALLGALTVPVVFMTMLDSGYGLVACIIASSMVLFGSHPLHPIVQSTVDLNFLLWAGADERQRAIGSATIDSVGCDVGIQHGNVDLDVRSILPLPTHAVFSAVVDMVNCNWRLPLFRHEHQVRRSFHLCHDWKRSCL